MDLGANLHALLEWGMTKQTAEQVAQTDRRRREKWRELAFAALGDRCESCRRTDGLRLATRARTGEQPGEPMHRNAVADPAPYVLLCGKCKKTQDDRMKRRRARSRLVALLGGKCNRCGWAGHAAGFDIHHPERDGGKHRETASEKQIMRAIRESPMSYELLCALCHRLEHAEAW